MTNNVCLVPTSCSGRSRLGSVEILSRSALTENLSQVKLGPRPQDIAKLDAHVDKGFRLYAREWIGKKRGGPAWWHG